VLLVIQLRGQAWMDGPAWLAVAAARHPTDFWVQFEAGFYFYAKDRRPAVASAYLRAAHTLRPDLALVKELLYSCFAQTEREAAVGELRAILRETPDAAWAQFLHGMILGEMRDLEGAIAAFQKATRLDPNNASSHDWLAYLLLEKGDPKGALVEAT